jgi:hypothetical protein
VDRANDKSLKQIRSKQLSDRAFFFKRLAIGAADPKFSSKLQGLVEEYERAAARITLEAEPASLQADSARPKGSPAHPID